jgi:hypothetical protein
MAVATVAAAVVIRGTVKREQEERELFQFIFFYFSLFFC